MVIIGGGVTGLEFAMIFQLLGSRVTIIEARERLLPDLDADLSAEIERIVKRKGVTVRKGKGPGLTTNSFLMVKRSLTIRHLWLSEEDPALMVWKISVSIR
ncbi:MAG: NAD-binding protein [Candidatus Scalinduaceae bacterium]